MSGKFCHYLCLRLIIHRSLSTGVCLSICCICSHSELRIRKAPPAAWAPILLELIFLWISQIQLKHYTDKQLLPKLPFVCSLVARWHLCLSCHSCDRSLVGKRGVSLALTVMIFYSFLNSSLNQCPCWTPTKQVPALIELCQPNTNNRTLFHGWQFLADFSWSSVVCLP